MGKAYKLIFVVCRQKKRERPTKDFFFSLFQRVKRKGLAAREKKNAVTAKRKKKCALLMVTSFFFWVVYFTYQQNKMYCSPTTLFHLLHIFF